MQDNATIKPFTRTMPANQHWAAGDSAGDYCSSGFSLRRKLRGQ